MASPQRCRRHLSQPPISAWRLNRLHRSRPPTQSIPQLLPTSLVLWEGRIGVWGAYNGRLEQLQPRLALLALLLRRPLRRSMSAFLRHPKAMLWVQVLDFAVFPEPKFDLPIFCANFFTSTSLSIAVLDLNPLYDVTIQRDYKDKYYRRLMPLGQKYAELLPWGDKLTTESMRFFSPIVLWTKFSSSQYMHDILYSAFMDYYKAWLELMEEAVEEADPSTIIRNCEAQHRYLTWRAEKDPGYPILRKLVGEELAKDFVKHFLFDGVESLGTKTFLDYFPEYRSEDGTVSQKRSIIGKSYETRPWDARGEFVGNKPG